MNPFPLILASASPRRQDLLKQIGLDFQVIPSNVEEDFSLGLSPVEFVEHTAKSKADPVARLQQDHLVIAADTVVVLDDDILGKPTSDQEAFAMLSRLSGRTHSVFTGVALRCIAGNIAESFHEITRVTLHSVPEEDLWAYIRRYKPLDKAGSYGIQDGFAVHIKEIQGCFFNVMGFPLAAFHCKMKNLDQDRTFGLEG